MKNLSCNSLCPGRDSNKSSLNKSLEHYKHAKPFSTAQKLRKTERGNNIP
jgi:hypothetical protein